MQIKGEGSLDGSFAHIYFPLTFTLFFYMIQTYTVMSASAGTLFFAQSTFKLCVLITATKVRKIAQGNPKQRMKRGLE